MNIISSLEQLARFRPTFHSEADFQHALAWKIHEDCPAWNIRLERCIRAGGELMHVDLIASCDDRAVAMELKYKTVARTLVHADEKFIHQKHGALPQGRYDFWKDVSRLERLASATPGMIGYALLLSSDHGYWKGSLKDGNVSQSFSLKEDRVASGTLAWSEEASAGTKKKRDRSITLLGSYTVHWHSYSNIHGQSFQYLCLRVSGSEGAGMARGEDYYAFKRTAGEMP